MKHFSMVKKYLHVESGAVYSCGANGECQLGLGSDVGSSLHTPQHVIGLPERRYTVLDGGTDHAAALTGQ